MPFAKLSEYTYGDLMTIEDWEDSCDCGLFIDYDGYGYFCCPEVDMIENRLNIYPSMIGTLQYKANRIQWSHILWFNR